MKKIAAIFLLLTLTAPFLLTYTCLQYEKQQLRRTIKRSMIAGIDKKKLVFLKFSMQASETDLRWEHEKEFEYRGQMYDIVEKAVSGDSIFFWCWADHEETALNKELALLLGKALHQDPQRNETQKKIAGSFKTPFHISMFSLLLYPPATDNSAFSKCIVNLTSFNLPPPVPPPRSV